MSIPKTFLAILLSISIANSSTLLNINNDYNKTIEIAKKENKPIFILFTKSECPWCKKLKSKLFSTEEIYKRLQDEYIVLFLDKEKDKYPQKYKIQAVPTVFLISPTEEIYTQIIGYHKKDIDYLKWFNYVKIERE